MTELGALFDRQVAQKPNAAADAAVLLAAWRKLERGHLPVSFGCSCGAMGHVRAQDFEQDVLDYLREKHAHADNVTALLQRFAGNGDDKRGDIATLLQGIADDRDASYAAAKLQIVNDLRRSISSWTEALGPADSRAPV